MSSASPEEAEKVTHKVNTSRQRLPGPKTIDAERRSRDSLERIRIIRMIAIGLLLALLLDAIVYVVLCWLSGDPSKVSYSSHSKDILIILSSLVGYLFGTSGKKQNQ